MQKTEICDYQKKHKQTQSFVREAKPTEESPAF